MRERLLGRRKPIKYSSDPTRYTSLDFVEGNARIDDPMHGPSSLPVDSRENLELKFRSGANRTDCPSRYGAANVQKKILGRRFSTTNDITGYIRKKGEPV